MTDILKQYLEISVLASIMIGIVLVIRQILSKKMSPAVMLLLWGMVLIRLTLPFTFASPVRLADLFPEQAYSAETNGGTVPANGRAPSMNPAANNSADSTGINAKPAILQKTSQKPAEAEPDETTGVSLGELCKNIPWWSVFAAIWAAGIAATLLISIWKSAQFRRKLRFCNPVHDKTVLESIQTHKKETGVKKAVTALECGFVHAPAVFGYFKPCILIPSRFINEMDTDSLDAILLHEVYHIRCHDILTNYIWLAAKALHWFNPLVWFAYKWFENDLELRRDQKAAQRLKADGTFVYSKSLLEAARFSRQKADIPSTAAALFEKKCKLKQRIVRLVKPQKRTKSAVFVSALLSMVMIVACFTTACQPTPEQPAVVNKNEGVLESTIAATPAQASSEQTIIENQWIETYTIQNLVCEFNTQITLPQTNKYPVYKVKKDSFEPDFVDNLIKFFTVGATGVRKTSPTKEELEQRLIQVKRGRYVVDDSGGRWEAYEGQDQDIANLEEQIKNAVPETFNDISTEPVTLPVDNTYLMPAGSKVYIQASNNSIEFSTDKYAGITTESMIILGGTIPGEPAGTTLHNVKISEEEACAKVNSFHGY